MNKQAAGALLFGIVAGVVIGEVVSRATRAAAERSAPAAAPVPAPVDVPGAAFSAYPVPGVPPRHTPISPVGETAVSAVSAGHGASPTGNPEPRSITEKVTGAARTAVVAVTRFLCEVDRGATFAAGIALGLLLRACGGPLPVLPAFLFLFEPLPVAGPGRILPGRTLALAVRCTPTRGPDAGAARWPLALLDAAPGWCPV